MNQVTEKLRIERPDPAVAEILRTKTPRERFKMAYASNRLVRERLPAHLGNERPDWSCEESRSRQENVVEQADVVRHVLGVLQSQDLKYAIVGSFASIASGEPRFPHDVDILIELTEGQVPNLCEAFPGRKW